MNHYGPVHSRLSLSLWLVLAVGVLQPLVVRADTGSIDADDAAESGSETDVGSDSDTGADADAADSGTEGADTADPDGEDPDTAAPEPDTHIRFAAELLEQGDKGRAARLLISPGLAERSWTSFVQP